MNFRGTYFILFFLLSCNIFSQQRIIDSLIRAVPATRDTSRANALIAVSREMVRNNPKEAKKYIEEAYSISKEFGYLKGQSYCLLGLGLVSYYQGDFVQAEKTYLEAVAIAEKTNDLHTLSRCYVNIGLTNDDQGNYEKAITWYFKGLEICESLHDEISAARALNNIGAVYGVKGKPDFALIYHKRSLAKRRKLGDKWGIASSLTNIGLVLKQAGNLDSSIYYYYEAMKLRQELDDTKGLALVINNIGSICMAKKNYTEATNYFKKTLEMSKATGDLPMSCMAWNNLGEVSFQKGEQRGCLPYMDSAFAIATKLGSKEMLMEIYKRYSRVHTSLKDFKMALKCNEQYCMLRDTVYNHNTEKTIFEMQSRYESQKKESEIQLLTKDTELQSAKIKQNGIWVVSLVSGILLFIILAGLVFSRGVIKKKANRELEFQNNLVIEQKKEITDSIQYALNIQHSMLPSDEFLSSALPEYFILYRPKDIVSGDFYFVEKIADEIIFGVIDCTGHGVPGALLSFLGMDILQDAVHRKGLLKPSEILKYLDREMTIRIGQTSDGRNIRDGMDLALCRFNTKTFELQTAGAFNPVYVISNGILDEIKPDKHAIGSSKEKSGFDFTNHTRQLKKGDCVYLLSDGYADQFGGPSGKKFKYKPLKDILVRDHKMPMKEQGDQLNSLHLEWKGGLFQVDDVLVMGVRI